MAAKTPFIAFHKGTTLASWFFAMKTKLTALLILSHVFTVNAWAAPTAMQIKRAQEVLSRSILPNQLGRLNPKKLESMMKPAAYSDLRPRDVLLLTEDVKHIYRRTGNPLIDNRYEGFASLDGQLNLQKGEYIRVVQKFASDDVNFESKSDFSGVTATTLKVVEFIMIKLDSNFEPIGETFFLMARGDLDRKIEAISKFDGGFMTRNPSLSFSRAGLGDVIVNAQDTKTKSLTIPAFSPAIITKMVRTRMNWTISNYNYVATIYLLNCPQEFRAQKCEVEISGTKVYADPNWAHYTMPENRREVKFWGMSIMY